MVMKVAQDDLPDVFSTDSDLFECNDRIDQAGAPASLANFREKSSVKKDRLGVVPDYPKVIIRLDRAVRLAIGVIAMENLRSCRSKGAISKGDDFVLSGHRYPQ